MPATVVPRPTGRAGFCADRVRFRRLQRFHAQVIADRAGDVPVSPRGTAAPRPTGKVLTMRNAPPPTHSPARPGRLRPAGAALATTFALALAMALGLLAPAAARAETWYAAPGKDNGNRNGTAGQGSRERPFASPGAALASGRLRGGDRLLLLPGSYGALRIANQRFSSPLTIASAPGGRARFDRIEVASSRNIVFEDLDVWPDRGRNDVYYLVRSLANAPNITFRGLDVRSAPDARAYRRWSKTRWLAVKASGILAQGDGSIVENNTVTGAYHALMIEGDGARLLNNRVFGFSGDAMRALGDNSLVRGNRVQDCVAIDPNHDDGFQTWSRGPGGAVNKGTVRGLTVEENIILEWAGPSNNALTCTMQGIFMTGGFENLTVRNNVVSVSAWHGITGYGIGGGKIVNNTLVNSRGPSTQRPWIGVWGDKNRASRQVIVANNIAPKFNTNGGIDSASPRLRNVVLPYPAQQLRDPINGDFRPKPDSRLIDRANPLVAPERDVEGRARPLGKGPDIGAYEIR